MKKKIILLVTALLMTITASAQFEEGKLYSGASLTGLNLSYNGADELNLGVQAKLGYMIEDDLMLLGNASFQIYLGVNAKFVHTKSYNDFMPGVEVGYAFFISRTVTIEPAIYYDQSFKDHSKYSTVGLKVGFGIYL